MRKSLAVIAFAMSIPALLIAQSANYQAQGKYYSAKQALQDKSYSKAIDYITQCKALLKGGSNLQIQYIHIMAAYYGGNSEMAQAEMQRFFRLVEKAEAPVSFDKSVEDLTDDEIKAVTKLIDPINEAVAASRNAAEQEKIRKQREPYDKARALLATFKNKITIANPMFPILPEPRAERTYDDGIKVGGGYIECQPIRQTLELAASTRQSAHRVLLDLNRAAKRIPVSGIESVSMELGFVIIKHVKTEATFDIGLRYYKDGVLQGEDFLYPLTNSRHYYSPNPWYLDNCPTLCFLNVDRAQEYYDALKLLLSAEPSFKGTFK